MLATNGTVRVWSSVQQVPYLIYNTNQWVGYDDMQSLTGKVSSLTSVIQTKLLKHCTAGVIRVLHGIYLHVVLIFLERHNSNDFTRIHLQTIF